jgi:hypothetical protein
MVPFTSPSCQSEVSSRVDGNLRRKKKARRIVNRSTVGGETQKSNENENEEH